MGTVYHPPTVTYICVQLPRIWPFTKRNNHNQMLTLEQVILIPCYYLIFSSDLSDLLILNSFVACFPIQTCVHNHSRHTVNLSSSLYSAVVSSSFLSFMSVTILNILSVYCVYSLMIRVQLNIFGKTLFHRYTHHILFTSDTVMVSVFPLPHFLSCLLSVSESNLPERSDFFVHLATGFTDLVNRFRVGEWIYRQPELSGIK